jgi:hypothetical protein
MSDPRYTWGSEFVMLRQDPRATSPQKIGLTASQGWAAYAVDGMLIVKTFEEVDGAPYPDRGCTVELFANLTMLEVETLGPLTLIEPGETTSHVERWRIWDNVPGITNEEDVRKHILPRLSAVR